MKHFGLHKSHPNLILQLMKSDISIKKASSAYDLVVLQVTPASYHTRMSEILFQKAMDCF